MMTFSLNLTPAVLSELTAKLSRLAVDVSYKPGMPGVLSIDNFDEANEPRIVDAIASVTRTADFQEPEQPYIDWLELAREAQREKRQAAAQAKADMARIRAKRQRQVGATVIGI